ncbi:MAG: ATP phosphoribosyltransferase [Symbiobacteriia bacterium]
MEGLTIAIPKGKLYEPTVALLTRAGLGCDALGPEDSRRLMFESAAGDVRFLVARPADVPTYVAHGAADLGVVGKDVLLEDTQTYTELLDLGFGECRMVLAVRAELAATAAAAGTPLRLPTGRTVARVATKFPRVTERFFTEQGWPAQIIVLHGAVELASAVGLADAIVDIVSTGQTLRENHLVPLQEIARSTVRLIANPAALHLKRQRLEEIVRRLRRLTEEG